MSFNAPSSEKVTITNVLLGLGKTLPVHTTPVDALFYGREGSGYASWATRGWKSERAIRW